MKMSLEKRLAFLQTQVYIPNNLILSQLQLAKESQEYHACSFLLNETKVVFRQAKITPKKAGQFVTLWKRIAQGPIQPLDDKDPIDLMIVNVYQGDKLGQFVFPQSALLKQRVISTALKEGKRAFRVYPPWAGPLNKQAQKTQTWQLNFFWSMTVGGKVDHERVKLLYEA